MKQQHKAFNIRILYLLVMTAPAFGLIPFNVTAQSNTPVADFKTAPTVQWKQHTNQPLIASPVIDNNSVFVGGLDSILYSIDLPSGKINWKFRTGGEIRSNVLISGNQLFLATHPYPATPPTSPDPRNRPTRSGPRSAHAGPRRRCRVGRRAG